MLELSTTGWLLFWVVLLLLVAAYLYQRYRQSRPVNAQGRLLAYEDAEARSFYRHLVGELDLIPPEHIPPPHAAKINDIREKVDRDHNEPTWDDLLSLELILHQLMPSEYLLRKAWITRLRYFQVLGPVNYAQYLATNPPRPEIGPQPVTSGESALVQRLRPLLFPESPPSFTLSPPLDLEPPEQSPPAPAAPLSPAEESSLRADLQVLLQETYWALRLRTAWEARRNWFSIEFRRRYLWTLAIGTLIVVGIVFAPVKEKDPRLNAFATFFAVALAGTLGGFISMLQRLQSLPDADPKTRLIEMIYGRESILWQSLLSGASFALVLMLIFFGGLISGELFPVYQRTGTSSFLDIMRVAPDDGVQFSKLLVWSFIAGFAERFVPDLLDRFTAQQQQQTQQQQTPPTLPTPPPPPPQTPPTPPHTG